MATQLLERPTTPTDVTGAASARRHLPALDAWRGFAVAVVVAFHADVLPGGWLGVDLFFVLSGFLITRLLVAEHTANGSVALGAFWARRAKRLLPALVVLFAAVAAYASWYPDPIALPRNLTAELAASAGYVANWFQISTSAGYWDTYSVASPLKHMWSLAIEEQFYILFPLVAVALLRVTRRNPVATFAVLAGAALAGWALAMTRLGADGAAFERVYLGTDTRAAGILAGAAAGYASVTPKLAAAAQRVAKHSAIPAAVFIAVCAFTLDGTTGWSWARWGWVVAFELAACAVLVAAASPEPRAAKLNAAVTRRPLLWLGTVSYGLYLWHFPALLAAERLLVGTPRWAVIAAGVGASAAIAQVSLVLVETPLRRGTRPRRSWVAVCGAGLAVVAVSAGVLWHASGPAREHHATRAASEQGPSSDIVAADSAPMVPPTAPVAPSELGEPVASSAPLLPLALPDGRDPRLLVVGDSMAYDLEEGLRPAARGRATVSHAAMVGCSAGGMDPSGSPDGLGSAEQVRRCDEFRASWPDMARTAAPDVMVIMRTSSRDSSPETGGDGDVCSAGYLEWYSSQLRAEIDALAPHVGVIAYTSAVYNRFGGLVFPEMDRRADCLNEATRKVTAGAERAVYLPVGEWACPTPQTCVETVGDFALRPDGLHFAGRGAEHASTWILDTLWGANP